MGFIFRKFQVLAILFLSYSVIFSFTLHAATFKKNAEISSEPWGPDSELCQNQSLIKNQPIKYTLASKACQEAIRFFQNNISPIDGPRSSYIPSSSQYALVAIQRFGIFKGIALGCDRLMRENEEPWVYRTTNKYGIFRKWDPVPKQLP